MRWYTGQLIASQVLLFSLECSLIHRCEFLCVAREEPLNDILLLQYMRCLIRTIGLDWRYSFLLQ